MLKHALVKNLKFGFVDHACEAIVPLYGRMARALHFS
jgi:hypothetical protein